MPRRLAQPALQRERRCAPTPFSRWAPDWEALPPCGDLAVLDGRGLRGVVALQRLLLVHAAFLYGIAALLHPRLPYGPSPATVVSVSLVFFAPALIAAIRAGPIARSGGRSLDIHSLSTR